MSSENLNTEKSAETLPESTSDGEQTELSLSQCFLRAFTHCTCEGRACRKEYWGYSLWAGVILLLFLAMIVNGASYNMRGIGITGLVLFLVSLLALIVPGLCVMVRRLHDINMSGMCILLFLIPCIGPVLQVIMLGCVDGGDESNEWGDKARV